MKYLKKNEKIKIRLMTAGKVIALLLPGQSIKDPPYEKMLHREYWGNDIESNKQNSHGVEYSHT